MNLGRANGNDGSRSLIGSELICKRDYRQSIIEADGRKELISDSLSAVLGNAQDEVVFLVR